jgi:Ca2+-transporting ATPase
MTSSTPSGLRPWHRQAAEESARVLQTSPETGLTAREARDRLQRHGPNELPEAAAVSPLRLFVTQFSSVIIWVLIGAAVVSGLLREWVDAAAILAIVLLNALLGFLQEYKAERSLAALKTLSVPSSRVVRDGMVQTIPARELVPGDLIEVEAGDHIPADARVVRATALKAQEAALTGESVPVEKSRAALEQDEVALGDRRNMLYLGTSVAAGKGRAIVVATGPKTEVGRIATLMREAGHERTPLQRRLEQFGYVLLYLALGIVLLVFALGLLRGEPLLEMFLTAVSLAVAAIPEGLPAIVTLTLALGVTKMVKRHALVRRLPAVETLGSTTVICTDKTGTLTKNEMTVTRLYVPGRTYEVTGEGYVPVGKIREASGVRREGSSGQEEATQSPVRELLKALVLCNGAALTEHDGVVTLVGDPTEGALLVVAAKHGLRKEVLEREHRLLAEIPFDADRKLMTMVRRSGDRAVAYVKGAPDVLLARCAQWRTLDGRLERLDERARGEIMEANSACARDALRVLGAAFRVLAEGDDHQSQAIEHDLVFLGLAAMKDPLRPEAIAAITACREAGIRVVMITGDHKETAMAIAREAGVLDDHHRAVSGVELDRQSDRDLSGQVEQIGVYARVSAEHKLRIVKAWKGRGAVVAMTGDGVNDAPAIKEADIGVAMGLTGTDVAKEAAALVVTDDNFASIAAAVQEGRTIFSNIRKAIHYLLSCNLSEVLVMLFGVLAGLPLPLLPVQILWINLVTDGLPALALAVDPPAGDTMRHPPHPPHAPILGRDRIGLMLGEGLIMALLTISVFAYCLKGMGQSVEQARSVAFTVLVMAQLFHAFNCRSVRESIFSVGWFTNRTLLGAVIGSAALQAAVLLIPGTRTVLNVSPFDGAHWLLALGAGCVTLFALESWKIWRRRQR